MLDNVLTTHKQYTLTPIDSLNRTILQFTIYTIYEGGQQLPDLKDKQSTEQNSFTRIKVIFNHRTVGFFKKAILT